MTKALTFNTFREFYPYYLSEHSNSTCRALHYIGSALIIIVLLVSIVASKAILLLAIPLIGYGFAWLGHFLYEHNKPATFSWPLWSLAADWVMFYQFLTNNLPQDCFKQPFDNNQS